MPTYKFVDHPCEQIGFLHRALKCCHLARFNGRLWPPPPPPSPTLPTHPGLTLHSHWESIPGSPPPRQPGAQLSTQQSGQTQRFQRLILASSPPSPPSLPRFSPGLPLPFSPTAPAPPPSLFPSSLSLLLSEPWQLLPMQRDAPIHSASQTLLRSLLNISSRRKGSFFPISEQAV